VIAQRSFLRIENLCIVRKLTNAFKAIAKKCQHGALLSEQHSEVTSSLLFTSKKNDAVHNHPP